MSAHAMLQQKNDCVRSLERKTKNVLKSDGKVAKEHATCPKCGHINTTDCQTECPECSIIYSQYQLVVKKAFDNTLAIIGRNGLETAEEELNALAVRYPSIKVTCDQHSAFINHAIKKHLTGSNELARDYFDKLINKQPVLKNAVAKFLGEEETEDSSSVLTENVTGKVSTVRIIRMHINKNGVLISCCLVLIMIVTAIITNRNNYNISTQRKHSVANISPENDKPVISNTSHAADSIPTQKKYSVVDVSQEKPVVSNTSHAAIATYTDMLLFFMNKDYGDICKIEVNGIFRKTLKVDWTQNTNKLYMLKVFAEIGEAKNRLYEEGVRYFQFPNNLCRYNVIDWKTGEKKSISDRAPYCFTD